MQKIPVKDTTQNEGKIYVRLMSGRFQTLRRIISWPMLTAFFLIAWLRIDGEPLLMFSFSNHRILIFGLELSWYDLQLLGGLLIAGATFLFFSLHVGGAGVVWICLPAKCLDLDLYSHRRLGRGQGQSTGQAR